MPSVDDFEGEHREVEDLTDEELTALHERTLAAINSPTYRRDYGPTPKSVFQQQLEDLEEEAQYRNEKRGA